MGELCRRVSHYMPTSMISSTAPALVRVAARRVTQKPGDEFRARGEEMKNLFTISRASWHVSTPILQIPAGVFLHTVDNRAPNRLLMSH